MQKILTGLATLLTVAFSGFAVHGQFDSGNDGSFAPIELTSGTVTIPLPADGIINATTVTIFGTLSFEKNELNTPVFLLATGDIIIKSMLRDRRRDPRGLTGSQPLH